MSVPALRPVDARPVVVHAVHSLAVGGLENGVVNVVNGTAAEFRHVIVCMTTEGPMRERLRPGVEVLAIGKRRGHDVRAFVRLARTLRRLRPRIVHSRNWAAFDAVAAARLVGVPFVVHGEHGREIGDPHGRRRRRNQARRLLAPLVSRFITVSEDLRRWLIQEVGLPAHKITTIHNGVDLSRFGDLEGHTARLRLGLSEEALVIGTVGRLDPVKDQTGLVRAFAMVLKAHPAAVLVIAGDGPCRADLLALVAELRIADRVRLLGARSDVPAVLAAMDVFALPSVAEGISNTILEAMASGLPVVATRVGGSPELIEDGVGGALVPPRDPAALAGALTAYLEEPGLRSLHGKSARQRVTDRFGLERMCEAYAGVYRSLLTGTPGRSA
ncbi:MAG TPA: TIGR03088 family PEP-CTERM/XrtA system glycosyltransferase [Candidatus Deferrimicrobiaceae bacterium]|nr:TIGR03088 family PEP-CTERM/XrtA system glycosyltransferase [Candidatus Deferrimicrobiaceae bacterium]